MKISLGGRLVEAQSAHVSVDSRSVRFGDAVFETIPLHAGRPYLWHYHMERMAAGLAALRIPSPGDLLISAREVIHANEATDGLLRIHVGRGGASRGYLPFPYPSAPTPTVIIETLPRPALTGEPMALWLSSYEKISPRALPTHCKLAQGVGPTLARMEAADHGCYEALQLTSDGHISEASAHNIFWRSGKTLHTPALACGALAGVTRRRLIEHSPLPVREGAYTLEDLQHADAVILTNAALGIVPVSALLPQGWGWQSDALAAALTALREKDMRQLA